MASFLPGDVVTFDFPGATGVKRRPTVIVSSDAYHAERPDLILGVLTTHLVVAAGSTDYVLQDWNAAGLHGPSAFRCYFGMALPNAVRRIGRLSDRDWQAVRNRIRIAIG
jgi:mRNA interferase MazF